MSTLLEIEQAAGALPPEQQQHLLRFLQERLTDVPEVPKRRRILPVVPATGRPITQQEIDDAVDDAD